MFPVHSFDFIRVLVPILTESSCIIEPKGTVNKKGESTDYLKLDINDVQVIK